MNEVKSRKLLLVEYMNYLNSNYDHYQNICGLDELRDLTHSLCKVKLLNDRIELFNRNSPIESGNSINILKMEQDCLLEFKFLKRAMDSLKSLESEQQLAA